MEKALSEVKVSSIFIYPVKSCRGISVSQAPVTPTGITKLTTFPVILTLSDTPFDPFESFCFIHENCSKVCSFVEAQKEMFIEILIRLLNHVVFLIKLNQFVKFILFLLQCSFSISVL